MRKLFMVMMALCIYAVAKSNQYNFHNAYIDSFEVYLDNKIKSIPDGKHFIFTTDSHVDYYDGLNYYQNETQVMAYVKGKLKSCCVVFGGDCLGSLNSSEKAAEVLSLYAEDKFNAFGVEFLWCQGNHDANATDGLNQIPSTEVYKRTTGIMNRYGIAVFDTEGVDLINSLSATNEEKEKMIAWWKLHYYYDDPQNKIRFIVLETGDGSDGIKTLAVGGFDGWEVIISYITFIGNALMTCPDQWDVVVVMHQMDMVKSSTGQLPPYDWKYIFENGEYKVSRRGLAELYELLSAFKMGTSVTIDEDGSVRSVSKPYLYSIMHSRIGNGVTFDFSNRTSGGCFCISGHFHHDDAWIVQRGGYLQSWGGGKEYDYIKNEELFANAILHIQTDRACLYDRGSAGAGGVNNNWPNAYSFPNNGNGECQEVRRETKNEVLFDVVTITLDNKVVCTRIGAGKDREYLLPVPRSYKLTYQVDGMDYKTYDVEYGAAITAESSPTKEGYTFSGWSDIPATMPSHDVIVTGTFAINSYKMTYVIDEKVYKEFMYEFGAVIMPEPPPEGDYLTFEWQDLPQKMPAYDVLVRAVYTTDIVELIQTRTKDLRVYSLSGIMRNNTCKDLYVIRFSNGQTMKVVGR